MDVTAYDSTAASPQPVKLGSVVDSIWASGFKFSEDRAIQVSKPINAAVPNLFDRITSTESFQFAAGRSFGGPGIDGDAAIAAALLFFGTHPAAVPRLAHLQFTARSQNIWLRGCGITRVELINKNGALVQFSYTVVAGTWSVI